MDFFKNKTIAFSLLLLSFQTFAQTTHIPATLKWGKEHEPVEALAVAQSIGFDKKNLYTVEADFRHSRFPIFYLLKYDETFNQIGKAKLETKTGEKEYVFEGVNMTKTGDLFLLSSYADKIQKRNILYSQIIDKESLKPIGDFSKIVEVPYESKYKYDFFPLGLGIHRNTGSFYGIYSSDKSKIALIAKTDLKGKADETFCISVLDEKMKVLWSKIIVLPYLNKLFDVLSFDVSNQGDVYIIGKLYNEKKKEKVNDKPNYKYQLLHYNADTEHDNTIDIQIKDVFITDLKVSVNKDDDVICAGFYSNKGTESVMGTYLTIVDGKTKKIRSEFKQKFDFNFVCESLNENEIKKAKKLQADGKEAEMNRFVMRDIVRKNDGGYLLTAEQFLDNDYYLGGNNSKRVMYYDDILIVSLNKTGDVEWRKIIPKRQATNSEDDPTISFATILLDDVVYILFNDSENNIKKNRFTKDHKLSYPVLGYQSFVLFGYDKEGNRSSKVLKAKAGSCVILPKSSKPLSNKEILVFSKFTLNLFGVVKGKQRFGRLVFGEEGKDE
jgi:hypothetical protein